MARRAFKIGDRVTRPEDVFRDKSPLRHGEVVNARFGHWTAYGYYPEIYDVRWDGHKDVSRGYLPHGLEMDAQNAHQQREDQAALQRLADQTQLPPEPSPTYP